VVGYPPERAETDLSADHRGCMVAAMSCLFRSMRPGVVTLVALALLLGINGFEGAIHSVHHLPPIAMPHAAEADSHEGGQDEVPAGATGESCQVAAAASHLTAIAVMALPVVGPSTAESAMVVLEPHDSPRLMQGKPAHERAPPSPRSLPS
jgi:hypothetical protein